MRRYIGCFFVLVIILGACNPSKHLKDNEYLLTKNVVKVTDKKSVEFGNLVNSIRPIPNKRVLDVFPIKAARYVNHLPVTDSLGNVIKDTKFMKRMREMGEEPVLLDTNMISYSLDQLRIAMKNLGYFDAEVSSEIIYKQPNRLHPRRHKAEVLYFVKANEPYFIRDISYDIDIFEYKRYILQDTLNRLFKCGDKYNAETLLAERDRIANMIRDQGYYYVTNDIISFEVDTLDGLHSIDSKNTKTLKINILVNFSRVEDPEVREQYGYKYYFNNVYLYPNYNPMNDYNSNGINDVFKKKNDSTRYIVITYDKGEVTNRKEKPIRDIRPRILTDNILTRRGELYSQTLLTQSRRKLFDLKNFNYIDIEVKEILPLRDSIAKKGFLNTYYKLTRNKPHSLSVQLEARSDKSSLSLTYSNKNLFRSAEYFNINIYGSLGWRFRSKTENHKAALLIESWEVGGEASLDFRRLLFFRKLQKKGAANYGTSIKVGLQYQNNKLYVRWLYNAALVYTFARQSNLTHTLSPIDISAIHIVSRGSEFDEVMSHYSRDFRQKYKDNFLLSFKYGLTYTLANKVNTFITRLRLESSGMLLSSIMTLAKAKKNSAGHYTIMGGDYGNYELAELDLRFTHLIDNKNSIATRFVFGVGVPLWNATTLPFEKSFSLGGSNSMRAWPYRSLGPGSYYNQNKVDNDIRTGDVKLEVNFEYRGTIYKFIKYGIFIDAGNIWLTHQDADMPNAEFKFTRFYKELALGAGVGLRLDFNFFIIRLDVAVPIYDPGMTPSRQWIGVYHNKLTQPVNIVFGIGHAF